MSSSFSSSISGIRAAFGVLAVSAHNTANINTGGFKKQQVNLIESDNEGVVVKIRKSTETRALRQNNKDINIDEASNVDIVEEIGVQIGVKNLLSANIAALKTANEVEKSLIDIVG